MEQLTFMIESSEAKSMAKKQGFDSVLNFLPIIVRSAQKLARPPISGFAVAAVGLASDGRIFIGVNVEFPGLPLHHSIHAEQFLIANLTCYPDTTLTNVVVSAYPCGHCRQFLQEIRAAPHIQISVLQTHDDDEKLGAINDKYQESDFRPLSYFLPNRFGPHDLLEKDVPLILETHDNGMILLNQQFINAQNGNLVKINGFSSLFDIKAVVLGALEAANRSHAPYSGCPSGMALVDRKGNIFKGSYMESAAYNPSLGPAQASMIAYISATASSRGGIEPGYGDIVGAVLVEKEGRFVRQEDTVRLFLRAVLPKCQFHVYHCKISTS